MREQLKVAQLLTVDRAEFVTAHGDDEDDEGTHQPRVNAIMLCATNAETRDNSACSVKVICHINVLPSYAFPLLVILFIPSFLGRKPAVRHYTKRDRAARHRNVERWLRSQHIARSLDTD